MKPQKKAVVARKATKMPTVAKKRRSFLEKAISDVKKEKKLKKPEKSEDIKKKPECEKKKLDKIDEKKKSEEKKKVEEKRKEKLDKADERKKYVRDHDRKWEKSEECKLDKSDEKVVANEHVCDNTEKKKIHKVEERSKPEKIFVDNKKKCEKTEEKKKNSGKIDEENVEDDMKSMNMLEDNLPEEKTDVTGLIIKKKSKEDKKKEGKSVKSEAKEGVKVSVVKDKKLECKKLLQKISASNKSSLTKTKKDSKTKPTPKKGISRKTVLAKKSHLSPVKKLEDKKIKLNKSIKSEVLESEDDEVTKKTRKKNCNISKNKTIQEKKPKLGRHMKVKLPSKNKITIICKKADTLKTLAEKVIPKKKTDSKETEKIVNEHKKMTNNDELSQEMNANDVKNEIQDYKDIDKTNKEETLQMKSQDIKKSAKINSKLNKKVTKKNTKAMKVQIESCNQISVSPKENLSEEFTPANKVCEDSSKDTTLRQEQINNESIIEVNLKVEAINKENTVGNTVLSDSEVDSDKDIKKSKQKDVKKKERANSPSDERIRRMRLFGFWSGPKRHRVASLNALAKVHCLYENETGGMYLGGFCKPKTEKEKQKKSKEEKEEHPRKEKEKKIESKVEENVPKRKLRNVPGLRGKHWDMMESSSSSSSSDEDCEPEKNVECNKRKITKRKRKSEEIMDLKDMVVCKRMASLNASAILAASYSDEKNRCSSSTSSDSSSDSEVETVKKRRQNESDAEKRKSRQGTEGDEVMKPSNKLVILNQDTDVTITGVYVNQTRSTHHESFCSITGMQYRISSTSHTQTEATAVATELHDQQKLEQPCKSYTPLGALSSMQPPGSQGNPSMSPRRHSAFSAPHQHGYYQPAGPLIQHPPTLPPVKGPPPEPTPTPPQNSEGSDDLVATSTTSGGTNSTGGFYRAYCPQYYGTPPQYPDLCYPPTYSHPHAHPPPYYKYAPTYRRFVYRQYYGYQESAGGGGPGGGGTGGAPAVVDYQPPPPPPGEYPLPPYYGGYPPPPPPPPPPNPAYLHSQGRPFVDHAAFQGCPCPMQSCPKNVDTGPLIGNGKGAPVVSGPGLSLPPSALVGPPSPARGLAGLAPPHGANAWDTDRVQLNTHRNLNQNQPSVPPSRNLVGGHNRPQNSDCRNKNDGEKLPKCGCQKRTCTSTCEVKMESLSPTEKMAAANCPSGNFHNFKLENNNVKCESCSMEIGENLSCVANCNVKCESDYKCDMLKCEQCMKEGQMAILEIDKSSNILLDEKLDGDPDVKEEVNDVVVIDNKNWKKPDYEATVREIIDEEKVMEKSEEKEIEEEEKEQPKCQKVTKRKLSLDSLSDSRKKRKVSKRTLSVGSSQDLTDKDRLSLKVAEAIAASFEEKVDPTNDTCVPRKKQTKKENQGQKRKAENTNPSDIVTKKAKSPKQTTNNGISNCPMHPASDNSIMETIDNVILQSLQMIRKKNRKSKIVEKSEKKKKIVKKIDLIKELASVKLSKVHAKSHQGKNKSDTKIKSKSQDCKSKGKGKSKSTDSKSQEAKSKLHEPKVKDNAKKHENAVKTKGDSDTTEGTKKPALIKKKRKSTKKTSLKKSISKVDDCSVGNDNLTLTRKAFLKPKWSNGWSWEGDPFEAKVYLTNEESAIRRCYASMKHESGDVLKPLDCVLLKSGPRKADLPFVAKIAALWENPDDGEMMFSLLWYYRPEHTEQGRTQYDTEDEVFASRHRDANSVACIEDKCYILTFNEYCRYRKNLRRIEEGLESPGLIVPPGDQLYPRENRQPPIPVPSDMVLFCRRVYDYRGKKLVKNPG